MRVTKPRPAHLKPGQESPRVTVRLETPNIKIAEHEIERAERFARLVVKQVRAGGAMPDAEERDSVAKWAERRFEWLAGRPRTETLPERVRTWTKWIDPVLGSHGIAELTPDDVRSFVKHLEDAVHAETIGPKRALNIYGELTSAMADATEANDASIRVRTDNPCDKVRGPEKGDARSKPFLRPAEVVQLLSCDEATVPVYRRALYALAVYTGARVGELRALAAEDVDFEAMQITIAKQATRKGELKGKTKTRRARTVRIEPALLPLLRVLVTRSGDTTATEGPETLLHVHNEDHARLLREDLDAAGCDRPAIAADDDLRAPLTFHGLRDTCLSHMAVRRDPPQDIQWRAGHSTPAMTEKYIAQARYEAGDSFGVPFPPLPASFLADLQKIPASVPAPGSRYDSDFPVFLCEGRELNPYRSNPAGT